MKKKLIVLAAVVVCIAIAASGTLAYFTAEDTATNVITSGSVKIDVVEVMDDGKPFPEEGITGIMPGQTVSKIVTVKSTGTGDAWIRVKLDANIVSAKGEKLDTGVMEYKLNLSESGWIDGGDGYYYYTQPVSYGEETAVLLEEVSFSKLMGNEYQSCTATVKVLAEAVQVKHNEIPEGGDVTDVAGWTEG